MEASHRKMVKNSKSARRGEYQRTEIPGKSDHSSLLQRSKRSTPSPLLAGKERDSNGVQHNAEEEVERVSASKGTALPEGIIERFENHLGVSLSGVRVHTDDMAAAATKAVGARAYAYGNDIYFGEGQYDPDSIAGQRLIAHEVVHTTQQSTGEKIEQFKLNVSTPGDALEQEAEREAEEMIKSCENGKEPEAVLSGSALVIARDVPPRSQGPAAPIVELPTDEFFARSEVEHVRVRTLASSSRLRNYVNSSMSLINVAQRGLVSANRNYAGAYSAYSHVIATAQRDARGRQEWADMFVGVGIGVLVGALADIVLPATAILSVGVGMSAATELVSSFSSRGYQALRPSLTGVNLELTATTPELLEMESWRLLIGLYSNLGNLQTIDMHLMELHGLSEYAIGEIRVHVVGGDMEMMEEEELQELVSSIIRMSAHSERLDREMSSRMRHLTSALGLVERAAGSVPSMGRMEKDIWILWVASLSPADSDLLDLDPIEDHLKAIGLLGPGRALGDFGCYTLESDERHAISLANGLRGEVRNRYLQRSL